MGELLWRLTPQTRTALRPFAGKVTVKIDGYVGSAASVIAMAGDGTLMPPVSYVLIHNPATVAIGDGEEMLRIKERLDEIKERIIDAYEAKTGLYRNVDKNAPGLDSPSPARFSY